MDGYNEDFSNFESFTESQHKAVTFINYYIITAMGIYVFNIGEPDDLTIIFVMWATTDHIEFIIIIVAKILEVIHYSFIHLFSVDLSQDMEIVIL
jgi:hypothetical protein